MHKDKIEILTRQEKMFKEKKILDHCDRRKAVQTKTNHCIVAMSGSPLLNKGRAAK